MEVHQIGERCNLNDEYCKRNGDWNTKLPLQAPVQLQRKVHTLSQKKTCDGGRDGRQLSKIRRSAIPSV